MAGKSISRPILISSKQEDSFVQSAAKSLRSWHERYHTSPLNPSTTPNIKVVCVADTHNTQPHLPPGDILLHAGDLSQYGTFAEIQAQLTWLNAQPHRWKVIIAGNHDLLLDGDFVAAHPDRELEKPGRGRDDLQWGDVVYLQNSAVELDLGSRRVKVFGSPLTPRFGSFAFQYLPREDVWCGAVPVDTDVLLTHGPPVGHLDGGGKGCRWLLGELWRARPRLAVFGHVHIGRGQRVLRFDGAEACYESVLRDQWPWVNLALMAWNVLWSAIWRTRDGPQTKYSQLVNAAIVGGQHGRVTRDPTVTFI